MVSGSLELLWPDGRNAGLDVVGATEADIPVLLRAVYGLESAAEGEMPSEPPATLAAVWTAQDDVGQTVTVNVWQDPDEGGPEA